MAQARWFRHNAVQYCKFGTNFAIQIVESELNQSKLKQIFSQLFYIFGTNPLSCQPSHDKRRNKIYKIIKLIYKIHKIHKIQDHQLHLMLLNFSIFWNFMNFIKVCS